MMINNWLDLVIIVVAVIGLAIGWRVGLLGIIYYTIGIFAGLFIASNFSDDIGGWFSQQGATGAIATVLAYLSIIIGVFLAVQLAKSGTKKSLKLVFLGWVDSVGSIVVGIIFAFGLSGALILGVARLCSDLPTEGAAGTIVEMTGFRGGLQNAMVHSNYVGFFIDFTQDVPGFWKGFIPGDYNTALVEIAVLKTLKGWNS
tara:strand:- start:104 stop:706 length:603 start_codon:yes stop_codon:yes gene_type:complete